MNLASALIKRVLEESDFDTWTNVRKHYLPTEYHALYNVITKHTELYHKLPSLGDLKLDVRDEATLDKVYALESIETDAEPFLLLEYLKNEFAQKETLYQLDKWVDSSMAFESAEEVVRHIQQIGIDLEEKIDLVPAEQNQQKINLFDSDEEMSQRIVLGFNKDFDERFQFRHSDYIMVGGKRGSGKSITCSNICHHVVESGKKALYFSIEMETREVLQRACAIATRVPLYKIKNRNLDIKEWERVAKWWSSRYEDSEDSYKKYLEHRDFDRFHAIISRHPLNENILDVVYDPSLTLGKVRAETEKRAIRGNLGLIGVDYINKLKRVPGFTNNDNLDWKEQLSMSHSLKTLAQDTGSPVFSPYQTDASGEARISKGILDSCDAAFVLSAHKGDSPGMTFTTVKMRSADDTIEFTSEVDWSTVYIGPNSIEKPNNEKGGKPNIRTGESPFETF